MARVEPLDSATCLLGSASPRALGELLEFFAERTRGYLTRLPGHR